MIVFPIHRIKLRPTEELLAIKAKKRPCIILSQYITNDDKEKVEGLTDGRLHLLQQEQIFLPIFSIQDEDSSSGFPEKFVKHIRKMLYPHLLYFPTTSGVKYKGKNFSDSVKEGIIRLDRVFSTIPHHAKISPTNIKISNEYMSLLTGYLKGYLLKEDDEYLQVVKELCQSAE